MVCNNWEQLKIFWGRWPTVTRLTISTRTISYTENGLDFSYDDDELNEDNESMCNDRGRKRYSKPLWEGWKDVGKCI